MSDWSLPVKSPPPVRDTIGESEVWGVLLAAGTSSRFGDRNKLLQEVDGEPMVRRVAETLLGAELAGVVAVLGHESTRVREALEDLNLSLVENEAYAEGQSTSVRTGVSAVVERDADAVLVALGDMPYISPETVTSLVAAYEKGAGSALAAAHEGKRGNPVLFDSRYFDELASVVGDVGGREILRTSDDAVLIETSDPGVRRDVDRPADWPESDSA